MTLLTDQCPYSVLVDGAEVPINTDFRVSIRFELLMQSDRPDAEKLLQALELYYPRPVFTQQAVEKMMWFFSVGKDAGERREKNAPPVYSFGYDAAYIYAAFLSQYGIDLQRIDYLHWWQFRALFESLKPDNRIVEIMGYRAMELTPDMSKAQRDFYRRMKKQFALPQPKKEQERLTAIEEALLHGGDVKNLLKNSF